MLSTSGKSCVESETATAQNFHFSICTTTRNSLQVLSTTVINVNYGGRGLGVFPISTELLAYLAVWRPRHTADMLTNGRQSFLCCLITCMELNRLSTDLKLLRSTDSFRREPKTFLSESVFRHQGTGEMLTCFVTRHRSTSRRAQYK